MTATKHQRQHRITKLLESKVVGSQSHLVELLVDEGIDATQTTVSRDLEELGALKVRLPGGATAYALPELPSHQVAPEDHLRRVLGEWVVEADYSGNLVVLRTPRVSVRSTWTRRSRSYSTPCTSLAFSPARMRSLAAPVRKDDAVARA